MTQPPKVWVSMPMTLQMVYEAHLQDRSHPVGLERYPYVPESALLAAQKQARVWEMKASGSLANNLCGDHRDKQADKPCLACTIESRDATLTRVKAELAEAVRVIQELIACADVEMFMRGRTDKAAELKRRGLWEHAWIGARSFVFKHPETAAQQEER